MVMRPSPNENTMRGPRRSISTPRNGVKAFAARRPVVKIAAVTALDQPNSSRIDGKKREKTVRAFTTTAIVTNAVATRIHP
jgi:hypothetical protein